MKVIYYLKENLWLVLILTLGAFLRFYKLDFQSIWVDELHTMIETNPEITFKESYTITAFREQMPQLYFLCVKLINILFGHTTWVVRAFSAIIGVASIYSIYLLGKEIKNKKIGLIAAILLAVNIFHISYSQEGRPYAMLALMTIFSFYRLIIFIKRSTLKNAIYYGVFTALMISTHFFGLFMLVAQALIILFFLFDLNKNERLPFFKLSVIAGLVITILWIPSLFIFLHVITITSFWIQPPNLEVYSQLFKEFFGNSEAVIFITFIIIIFYFITLFQVKRGKGISYKFNPLLMSFIIIIIWIFTTLFIPLIRSYLDIPMIISRYFIGVLPAIIIMIAIGINSIKNRLMQTVIIVYFIITSLTDLLVIKNYYNTVNKTQFREITTAINKRNINKDKVVSSWGWLMSYFVNEESIKTPLLTESSSKNVAVECTFENYISLMRDGKIPMDSFWYLDGNSRPYNLRAEDEQFLKENFIQKSSLAMFDTWTRHYISKTQKVVAKNDNELDIKDFTPLLLNEHGNFAMFENSTITSPDFMFQNKTYNLTIEAKSTPEKPINNDNAHIIVKFGNQEIGNFFLSEKSTMKTISFTPKEASYNTIKIIFDNDLSINELDRNVVIYRVKLQEK